MKITCQYSGAVLTQDKLFPEFEELNLASLHPIFSASNKVLLSHKMLSPWYQGTMSNEAKKLLFLAVAHNNGLLVFERGVIAAPDIRTVETCFFPLIKIVSWLQDMSLARMFPEMPQYRINLETQSMDNFRQYLLMVERTRAERLVSEDKQEYERKWEAAINKLTLNINAGMVSAARSLNGALARWALSVTPVPQHKKELWGKLLVMTDKQLLKESSDEVQELHDFMEWELPHGNTASARVMVRCREMLEVSTNLLGMIDNSFFVVNSNELNAAPSLSTGKVTINNQQYSPKVQEALRTHAAMMEARRNAANQPVASAAVKQDNEGEVQL